MQGLFSWIDFSLKELNIIIAVYFNYTLYFYH